MALSLSIVQVASAGLAQDISSTRPNILGRAGILEMPSAEVAPDGQLSLSFTKFGNIDHTTLTFQATPRFSGSFRYSGIKGLDGAGETYRDQTFDLSYLIFNEGKYRPAVVVGLQDFLGTGVLSGEYIVATKSFGEKLRVTGGLGWGRLGSYNPLGLSSGVRDAADIENNDVAKPSRWFTGDAAAFGGVSYQFSDKMTLLAEYSSDAYSVEEQRGVFSHQSPFNIGLNYKLGKNSSATAFVLHGDQVGVQISMGLNPKAPKMSGSLETTPLPIRTRPSRSADPIGWSGEWVTEVGDASGIRSALSKAMKAEGLTLEAMSLSTTRAEVRFANTRYGARAQALGRLSRIMTRAFPASVETFVLTETLDGIPIHSTVLPRTSLEAFEFEPARKILDAATFADPLSLNGDPLVAVDGLYPKNKWSIAPYFAVSFADPDKPVELDYGLRGQVHYNVAPGLWLDTSVSLSIPEKTASTEDNGGLGFPAVRSNSDKYNKRLQLDKLIANWYSRPAENVFGRVTAGYFETMYGGASGELLWKTPDSPLALGVEVNYAVQRDFEDAFAFQDYDVMTGHLSAYYAFEQGVHGTIDVGRYLGGDWGTTISVDREFNNGWRVGAYATFTDAPFDDVDKGIRVTAPSAWFLGTPTTETQDFSVQTSSHDGGARLNVDGRLYDRVRAKQGSQIKQQWGRFWR